MRQRIFSFLDDLGLVAAVEWQVNGFQHRADMQCQLDLPEEEPDLRQEERTALFRILQESLLNVLCHSNATGVRVSITLQESGYFWLLRMMAREPGARDTGQSDFRSDGMRERARIFGGIVSIRGEEGIGTTISAKIPLNGRRGRMN